MNAGLRATTGSEIRPIGPLLFSIVAIVGPGIEATRTEAVGPIMLTKEAAVGPDTGGDMNVRS